MSEPQNQESNTIKDKFPKDNKADVPKMDKTASTDLRTTLPGQRGRDGLFMTKTGKQILLSDAECCLKAWDEDDAPHYDEVLEHEQEYFDEADEDLDYGEYGSEVERA